MPGTRRNSEYHLWHPRILRFLILTGTRRANFTLNKWHPQFQIPNLSPDARYYHDRQLVDGVTASFWSKQTVECGKQFTGKSSASMCQVCNIFLHCTLYLVLITAHLFLELEEFASYLGRTDNPPSIIAHNRTTYFLNEYFAKVSLSLSSRMGWNMD